MHRFVPVFVTFLLFPSGDSFAQTEPASRFVAPTASAPAAGSLFWYPERVPVNRGRELVDAERGLMFVPVNRSDSGSDVTAVEVYRFRASTDVDPTTPPIFLLHGGPGWPGLEPSLGVDGYYERAIEPLRDAADLVVVGQRGIGSSKPNTICASGGNLSAACRAYWESTRLDLQGFTVIEAAADVRDIANALGYDQIQISGGSFGSHWGMTVIRNYPELVARAVLTGMEGPDHTYDMPGWILNSIARMAETAERHPDIAPHVPEGGLLHALATVRDRLEEEPVRVRVEHPETGRMRSITFNPTTVQPAVYGMTGRMNSRDNIAAWAADILYLYHGEYETAAKRILAARSGTVGGGGPNYQTASYFMLDCGSGITPDRLTTLLADTAAAIVGALGGYYQANCPSWDSDLGDGFRTNFDTQVPTVIVHGNWDISTPLENALELAPHFEQSTFVLVNGGTHGALREALDADEAFRDALMQFYRTGDRSGLPDQVDLPAIAWEVPDIRRIN